MEIWFGFSFGALQGKGIDNKINQKKWVGGLICFVVQKKKKKKEEKWADIH